MVKRSRENPEAMDDEFVETKAAHFKEADSVV